MAKKNRVDLNAVIQSNLPDNTTDFITPALDREVEIDEIDSCFNLEDDTAVDVNYNPTSINSDWLPEGDPTEVRRGLDILAVRTVTNLSQDIAYVSNETQTGVTPEVGNPLKPFATIQAGVDAIIGANGTVKVLGGAYIENVQVLNKQNFFLDCRGVTVTGSFRMTGNFDSGADFTGTEVTSTSSDVPLRLGGGNIFTVRGGKFTTGTSIVATTGTNGFLIGCQFVGTATSGGINLSDSRLVLCTCTTAGGLNDTYGSVFLCSNSFFTFCSFIDTGVNGHAYTTQAKNTFYDCSFESEGITLKNTSTPQPLSGVFENCNIKSNTNVAVRISDTSNELKIAGGKIVGFTDAIKIEASTVRLATTTNIIDNVKIYAGSGDIFNEPTYAGGDLGILLSINNTYNKTFVPTIKIQEHNKFEYVGLQDV
jgi:hypothetical protein